MLATLHQSAILIYFHAFLNLFPIIVFLILLSATSSVSFFFYLKGALCVIAVNEESCRDPDGIMAPHSQIWLYDDVTEGKQKLSHCACSEWVGERECLPVTQATRPLLPVLPCCAVGVSLPHSSSIALELHMTHGQNVERDAVKDGIH